MRKRKYTALELTRPRCASVQGVGVGGFDSVFESADPYKSNQDDPGDDCPVPTIHNIVSTSMIESDALIDLSALSRILPYSFYCRERFAAITIRLRSPGCTTLLFSSGKLVVTGAHDWFECVLASLCICRILRDAFPAKDFKLVSCDIQNIVGHVELPVGPNGMLDLQSMHGKLELNSLYQSTMFPGLILRPEASPVVLLCFFSGRVVITGGKTTQDVFEGWRRLWPTVRVFMREKC